MTLSHYHGAADDGLLQQTRIAHGWADADAGRLHDEFHDACEHHDILTAPGRDLDGHIFTAVELLSHGEHRWLESREWFQVAHSLACVFTETRETCPVFANLALSFSERADSVGRAAR